MFVVLENRFVLMKGPATGELGKHCRLLREQVSFRSGQDKRIAKYCRIDRLYRQYPVDLVSATSESQVVRDVARMKGCARD